MKSTRTLAALAALILLLATVPACSDDPEPGSNNDSNNTSNNGVNNDPGNNEPGNNDPGNNDPGNNDPGNNDPGNNDPGNNEPGNNEPGNNEPGNNDPGNNDPGNNEPGDDDLLCAVRIEVMRGLVEAHTQLATVEAGERTKFCWELPIGEQAPRQWRFRVEREENALEEITEWTVDVGFSGEATEIVYGECPDGAICTEPNVLTPGRHFVHLWDADNSFGLGGSTVFTIE